MELCVAVSLVPRWVLSPRVLMDTVFPLLSFGCPTAQVRLASLSQIYLSISPSLWLSVCLSSVYLSLSLYLSMCLSLYLCLSVCLSICLCLSVHRSVSQFFHLSGLARAYYGNWSPWHSCPSCHRSRLWRRFLEGKPQMCSWGCYNRGTWLARKTVLRVVFPLMEFLSSARLEPSELNTPTASNGIYC